MVVVAFLIGVVAAVVLWRLTARSAFAVDVFRRENYRGRSLPTAVGLVIVLVVLVAGAVVYVLDVAGTELEDHAAVLAGLSPAVLVVIGFGFLGFADDIGGVGQSGGFRGHLRALARGRLTTGAIKLFGGAAVAIVAVAPFAGDSVGRLLLDAALVALSANLANLLDRAPGRVTKVALLAAVVLAIAAGFDPVLAGVALALGAGAGLLLDDLGEKLMLGDAGANVLGAALGLGVVLTMSPLVRTITLLVVAALNLASELVSFSKVINQVPPLRAADRFGRNI
jgi:UDP-GlcNAc:undecaprenyl-phosphate/decaprenyl-phosphate GlcNAc-1-phosphate transferase